MSITWAIGLTKCYIVGASRRAIRESVDQVEEQWIATGYRAV